MDQIKKKKWDTIRDYVLTFHVDLLTLPQRIRKFPSFIKRKIFHPRGRGKKGGGGYFQMKKLDFCEDKSN